MVLFSLKRHVIFFGMIPGSNHIFITSGSSNKSEIVDVGMGYDPCPEYADYPLHVKVSQPITFSLSVYLPSEYFHNPLRGPTAERSEIRTVKANSNISRNRDAGGKQWTNVGQKIVSVMP